ncbi:mRNA decay activator protein ZFP36L2 isoform X2 [Electrophorus electricus]|uniref:mRNA decay activator protein ZFP36 n=1 Tax=Electrophorus electricus TaxID=8005 RepID=A0A4W4GHL3_ELEEL|nr:mRNA decay activator protein ZFP36L2 isoform X2 [Electrophorus electricus]
MSASVLSSIYDFDLFYREKTQSSNAIHLNNMLDKRTIGIPLATSNTNNNRSNATGYFRSNSASHMDSISGSKFQVSSQCNNSKENPTPAYMNKENKFRSRAFSETGERSQQLQEIFQPKPGSQINSTRYKTELCRPFEENGSCKYGEKCQFAHGYHELRNLSRHPKYKTEPCRTFHTIGFCPYGPRCHFIHNVDERRAVTNNVTPQGQMRLKREIGVLAEKESNPFLAQRERPKLHHSLSFSGFSSSHETEAAMTESPVSRTPPPPTCSLTFFEDALTPSSCLSAFSFPEQDLKAFLAPLIPQAQSAFNSGALYSNIQPSTGPPSPPFKMSHLPSMRPFSESPVFDSPPSPLESLSDPESFVSGSCCSSGTISGSESPNLDSNRRLPIFSRLSISDD